MDLYFKNHNNNQNQTAVIPQNCFCITDRLPFINGLCEEYNIIKKIQENKEGYFDFSKNLIDVGAEDGNYSMLLDFNENWCFEPNKHMCCLIYTNMYLKNKVCNTHVYNCGCGEKEEDVQFNGFAQHGSGFYKQSENRKLDKSYETMHKIKLDSLGIENVGLFKTDTEGFDLEVLKGSVETLKKSNYPPILFECWNVGCLEMTQERHDELWDFLHNLGYDVLEHWGDHETHLAIKK